MNFFKQYKLDILALASASACYFMLRMYHILTLPIFTDEAIYTRWAQIAKQDTAQRFISLTDGKQPLFIWFAAVLMRFIHDPLLAARMVSVLAGFATMIGLYFLGKEIFKNRKIGLLSAVFYLFSPFGLVYDKMALYDSLVGTFAVWGLFISILLVRKVRLDVSFILGLVVGIGMLNKTNAESTLILLPFNLLLFDWRKKERTKRLLLWVCYAGLAAVLAYTYYSILRLSPLFYMVAQKNTTFLYPLHEWLQHPFTFFIGNMHGLLDWFFTYTTIPIVVMVAVSFFISRFFWREKILLLLWFVIPLVYAALFGKVLYPRYILFMILPLLPLAAYTLYWLASRLKNTVVVIVCFFIILFPAFYADYFILNDFAKAPIPKSDLRQYSNDWPAGGGVKETIGVLKAKAANGKIYVVTEGTFGLMPYALEIYLVNDKNVKIQGLWPISETPPKELISINKKIPVYAVFYQPCPSCINGKAPIGWPVTEIAKYRKGDSSIYLYLYQFTAH